MTRRDCMAWLAAVAFAVVLLAGCTAVPVKTAALIEPDAPEVYVWFFVDIDPDPAWITNPKVLEWWRDKPTDRPLIWHLYHC